MTSKDFHSKLYPLTRLVFLVICLTFASTLTAQRVPLPSHIAKPNSGGLARLNVYADNWFKLYINGKLIAVDSIGFMPHNIISVEVLPEYPMTIAVMARDNADAITGKEYEHSQIGEEALVRPPRPFHEYDFEGAKFIWTDDHDLHNTVIFRTTIEKARWNTGTPVRRIEDMGQ